MSRANYIFHGQILTFFVTATFGKPRALFSLLSRAFQKVSRGKKNTVVLCGRGAPRERGGLGGLGGLSGPYVCVNVYCVWRCALPERGGLGGLGGL